VWYDLSGGTVGGSSTGSGEEFEAAIEDVGGGWYRCSASQDYLVSLVGYTIYLSSALSDGGTSYTGTGGAALILFGAQLSLGDDATDPPVYVVTGASAVPYEKGMEDLETFWGSNERFETSLISSQAAQYTRPPAETVPKFVEDYEERWSSNESFLFTLGSTENAEYDTANEDYEDLEEEWDSNESFITSFSGTAFSLDDLQGGTDSFEGLEVGWGVQEEVIDLTFNGTTDVVIFGGGGPSQKVALLADEPIEFVNQGGQTLPTGLSFLTMYFVRGPDLTDFELAASPGGAKIDFTGNGSGGPFVMRRLGGNLVARTSFSGVGSDLEAASYDTTPEAYEDLEEDWPNIRMTTV
jgi:hypothetical protein